VSPVKYELAFYIPEDDILLSHRRGNLKFYIVWRCIYNLPSHQIPLADIQYFITYNNNKESLWPLVRKRNIPTERPPLVYEI
jgi:hypothetical protein